MVDHGSLMSEKSSAVGSHPGVLARPLLRLCNGTRQGDPRKVGRKRLEMREMGIDTWEWFSTSMFPSFSFARDHTSRIFEHALTWFKWLFTLWAVKLRRWVLPIYEGKTPKNVGVSSWLTPLEQSGFNKPAWVDGNSEPHKISQGLALMGHNWWGSHMGFSPKGYGWIPTTHRKCPGHGAQRCRKCGCNAGQGWWWRLMDASSTSSRSHLVLGWEWVRSFRDISRKTKDPGVPATSFPFWPRTSHRILDVQLVATDPAGFYWFHHHCTSVNSWIQRLCWWLTRRSNSNHFD